MKENDNIQKESEENSFYQTRSDFNADGQGSPSLETIVPPTARPYPLWADMLAIVGVLLAAQFAGGFLKLFLERTAGITAGFGTFVSYVVAFGLTIAFALWQRKRRGYKGPLLRFSFARTNPSIVLWGVILVVVCSIVLEPLLVLFPTEYLELLDNAIGTGGWAMVTTVVCAPILEEILFRGIIQENVTARYGGLRGVLVAAALFGIIHFIPQQAINAFFIGIILGYIYISTKSLLPVIAIHAINNAIAFTTMIIFGDSVLFMRDLIGSNLIYWTLYTVCVLLLLFASLNIYRTLKSEKSSAPR